MKSVLFVSSRSYANIDSFGIYSDLLRKMRAEGNKISILCAAPQGEKKSFFEKKDDIDYAYVKTINDEGESNFLKKGIRLLSVEFLYNRIYKKYLGKKKFDLVLYATPPITLCRTVKTIKEKSGAKSYLMLKDIFPQNAIDIGIMTPKGWKGILYRLFRKKEMNLYQVSDYIGCMSQANVDYLIKHDSFLEPSKIEICPNCIEIVDKRVAYEDKKSIREQFGLPLDKTVLIYGGNLGKPQGIDFLIDCLEASRNNENLFFAIVGNGTEYEKIEKYIVEKKPPNVILVGSIPKESYERMVSSCDIGLVFLDCRFTIPNYPSRVLSYMQAGLPVLACTDKYSDIGQTITKGEFGWWCESNNIDGFTMITREINSLDVKKMGEKSFKYLVDHFSVEVAYHTIMEHFL